VATSQWSDLAGVDRAWQVGKEEWRAWHIFLQSTSSLDRLLVEGLLPEMRRLGSGIDFFFLRYRENGPHVRVRLRGLNDEQFLALGNRLRNHAEAIVADTPSISEQASRGYPTGAWQIDPQLTQFAPGRTVEIMYEPEFRRYGGRHALRINERLFGDSSKLALAIIEKTIEAPDRRISIALTLTAVAIIQGVADRHQIAVFLDCMKDYWRAYLSDAQASEVQAQRSFAAAPNELRAMVSLAGSPKKTQPLVERWRLVLEVHFAEMRSLAESHLLINPLTGIPPERPGELEAALQNIRLSQIHMMNNRLGITPEQEFLFASILSLALASVTPIGNS
jgi:thiopeptide-type bacteriocin biosynthesis protein